MVKHEKASYKNGNKKKNMVVNLGKNGGGVGGIIFLGGVLVTGIVASVLAVRKRNHKSKCDKANNPKTSASLHSFDREQETKGLQFLVPNCCPEEHQQQLRNRKADGGVTKASSVTCSTSNENICKDGPEVEFEANHDHHDLLVDDEGNHQENSKTYHGNARDLEDRKLQIYEGEMISSNLAREHSHEISIAQNSILNRKQSNMGSLVSDNEHIRVMESEERIGLATQEDDRENGKLQLDDDNIEKCDEDDDEIIKHNLEVPNSGEILHGCPHSEPGNRIQEVSSPSHEFMDSVAIEDVVKESLDGEDTIEDEVNKKTLLMASQQYDDGEKSSPMEINETSDTSSIEANIAADDPIKKPSEENDTYEDHEILDGSHESTEEVEDNSEGTLDSSAESNSDAIWPTDTIQEIGIAHEAGPEKDNIEKINDERLVLREQMNHNEQGNNFKVIFKIRNGSRARFIDLYNMHLNLMKWRILLGTLLVLVLHLCFRYNVKEDNQQSSE